MPRRKEEVLYMENVLSEDEVDILRIAARGERFVLDGWKKYGSDWPQHLPRMEYYMCNSCDQVYTLEYEPENANLIPVCPDCMEQVTHRDSQLLINIASRYLFSWQFQRYQAELHYCPLRDRMVMGGRGCGKTETLAISHAMRTILWPGHDWLHVAPSLDQAKLVYFFLIKQGKMGKFWDLFVKDYHTHPLPEIFLHSWNEFDPGTRWLFRTIGDSLERVRGERVGIVSVDEGFRLFPTDWYVGVLAGTARGVNEYTLNMNQELADEYHERVRAIEWELNPMLQRKMIADLDRWVVAKNLAKHTEMTMIGNAPYHMVWWNRYDKGLDSDFRWSTTWTSRQNLFLSDAQIEFWSMQFTDKAALAVELEATRPKPSGDVFPYLEGLFVSQLDELATEMVDEGEPGWVYKVHKDFGLYHYEKPPEKDAVYAFGADPGAGKLPGRNKWVILGARIDQGPPFEIVYFQAGSLPGLHGSIDPWIQASQDILARYPMVEFGYAAEAGGPQRHVHTVVWPDDLYIVPLNMNMSIATEVLKLQRMLRGKPPKFGCMFHMPSVSMAEIELAEFKLSMKKTDPQDVVVAFLALANRVYPWVAQEWEVEEKKEEQQDFWETWEYDRDVRDLGREIRWR